MKNVFILKLENKNRTVTPQQWLAHSKYNKDKSDAEMQTSLRLRENIQQTMAQSQTDLEAQRNATEYAMRKRIHETENARDELLWQKKNVRTNYENPTEKIVVNNCNGFL